MCGVKGLCGCYADMDFVLADFLIKGCSERGTFYRMCVILEDFLQKEG